MSAPQLACVVLAVGAPPEVTDAVRSLQNQDESVEILVVNSSGGDIQSLLPGVRCVTGTPLLLPGAARNVGVAATSAPWVAFLAADCMAEPGWVATRLRAHRAGAAAVASAITNPYRHDLPAWASYVSLFSRRTPGTPAAAALRYGASYARELLARCSGFHADLRTGEDTELHSRLPSGVEIVWEPAVRTAHRHPRTLDALLRDQRQRGRRSTAAWRRLGGPTATAIATNAVRRMPASLRAAWRYAERGDRRFVLASAPLMPLAALAYAAGALAPADAEHRS